MALPKLNAHPKYEMAIPSTKQMVRYRPYLVQEEKVLLLAMESQDTATAIKAIVDTITACVDDEIDANKLTTYDVEWMFIQLRSKSVGEKSKIGYKCKSCEASNELDVDLSQVTVVGDTTKKTIQLTNDISITMKYPEYMKMLEIDQKNVSGSSVIFWLIRNCIESINTDDEKLLAKDHTEKELDEFIESMTNDQFQKLTEFVESMPKVTHEVEFNCTSCNENNKITLEGLNDFF